MLSPTVAVIEESISKRGFFFADRATLDQLLHEAGEEPWSKLRHLQTFTQGHGWRVVTRNGCTNALFVDPSRTDGTFNR